VSIVPAADRRISTWRAGTNSPELRCARSQRREGRHQPQRGQCGHL